MQRRLPHRRAGGATLVEAGAVLAITAIAAMLGTPGLARLVDERRLDAAATALAADMHAARIEAIARRQPVRLAIDATRGCWLLHTAAAGSCSCTPAGTTTCTGDAIALKTYAVTAADGLRVASNAASIAFDPVLGTATPTATLRVTSERSAREVRHVVNVMGRTRSCATGASLAWRAC